MFLSVVWPSTKARAAEEQKIRLGSQIITVEVVRTPEQRQQGLMFRRHLDKSRGMLFVFNFHSFGKKEGPTKSTLAGLQRGES